MKKNVKRIANALGATLLDHLPDTGGGAFGAARLALCIESLQARLVPSAGKRTGRPSEANWVRHPKVPMSESTKERLERLAERASANGRKVSAMQVAAQILEDALADVADE